MRYINLHLTLTLRFPIKKRAFFLFMSTFCEIGPNGIGIVYMTSNLTSFVVINLATIRKPICNFLQTIRTVFIVPRFRMPILRAEIKIFFNTCTPPTFHLELRADPIGASLPPRSEDPRLMFLQLFSQKSKLYDQDLCHRQADRQKDGRRM